MSDSVPSANGAMAIEMLPAIEAPALARSVMPPDDRTTRATPSGQCTPMPTPVSSSPSRTTGH